MDSIYLRPSLGSNESKVGLSPFPQLRLGRVQFRRFDFLRLEKHNLELVRMVLYNYDNPAAYPTYLAALNRLLPSPEAPA